MLVTAMPLTEDEVRAIGFKHVGRSVTIDPTARFFRPDRISIADNSRIDANTVISGGGGVTIGAYCHIAVGTTILGSGSVLLEDYCGISAHCSVFSATDDFSGSAMTNPTVPAQYLNVIAGKVVLRRHAIVGAGTVIMPDVEIGIGAAIGALTLVNKSVPEFCMVSGNPMRRIGERSRQILDVEKEFVANVRSRVTQ